MNNSAYNLLLILEECRKKNTNRSCADTWREVLEVSSHTELLGALGQFFVLADNASKEILAVHGDTAGIEYWKLRLFNGFHSASLAKPWSEFIQHIDEVTIFTLRSHAALVDSKRPLGSVSDENFDEISRLLEQAAAMLMELALPDHVKVLILSRIEQLRALISRHRFVSPSSLLDMAKVLAAEISVVEKEHSDVVHKSKFYETVKEGLEILANATQVASSTPMMLGTTTYLLGLIS